MTARFLTMPIAPACRRLAAKGGWMKRSLIVLGAIALVLLTFALPVQARTCYDWGDHTFCLAEVRRSAKYHWEYRVRATLDGNAQPLTRYNCRDRTRTPMEGPQQGRSQPFESEGMGDRLCRLVNR